jgi:hypothetical protein
MALIRLGDYLVSIGAYRIPRRDGEVVEEGLDERDLPLEESDNLFLDAVEKLLKYYEKDDYREIVTPKPRSSTNATFARPANMPQPRPVPLARPRQ